MSGDGAWPASVFLTALGDDAAALRPEVLRYSAGAGRGEVGVCDGVFTVAGSRFGRLSLLALPFVGPDLLVTRHERDVPFHVVNRPGHDVQGRRELRAERVFQFGDGEQRFVDALQPDRPGTLRNLLGRRRRVELRLRCSATAEGHLRLRSDRAWLRLGRLRLRLPRVLGVQVEVEDGFDETTGRQTVVTRAWNPVVGTVIEYRGSFRYRIEPLDGSGAA